MNDVLLEAAVNGNFDTVKSIIRDKGNPSSTDKYGLSPLMYAVWNGHSECAKMLLANGQYGVTFDGVKGTSYNLISCKGYTALHLVALESLPWSGKEICYNLLLFGVDRNIRCNQGHTAYEIAKEKGNSAVVEAFTDFEELEKYNDLPCIEIAVALASRKKLQNQQLWSEPSQLSERNDEISLDNQILQDQLNVIIAKYGFIREASRTLNIPEIEKVINKRNNAIERKKESRNIENGNSSIVVKHDRNRFIAHDDLKYDNSTVNLPSGMAINEHNISAMTIEAMYCDGLKSLNCLEFVKDQAQINLARRGKILVAAESDNSKIQSIVSSPQKNNMNELCNDHNIGHNQSDIVRNTDINNMFNLPCIETKRSQQQANFAIKDSPILGLKTKVLPSVAIVKAVQPKRAALPWDDDIIINSDQGYLAKRCNIFVE